MKHADIRAAQAVYTELAAAMARVPKYDNRQSFSRNAAARDPALDAVRVLIESKGGIIRKRFDGTVIRLFGLRASSTSGFENAVRNWMTQMTLKSAVLTMNGRDGH